jgi:hypothetical protein
MTRQADPMTPVEVLSRLHVARAELVLVHDDLRPLADIGVFPDPLFRVIRPLIKLDVNKGESGSIILDLLPLTPRERRRYRRKVARRAGRNRDFNPSREFGGFGGGFGEVLGLDGKGMREVMWGSGAAAQRSASGFSFSPDGGTESQADLEMRRSAEALSARLSRLETAFRLQVLIRIRAASTELAELVRDSTVDAFNQLAGSNAFQVHGYNLGVVFITSADIPGLRWHFDRRVRKGLFRPMKHSVVPAGEVATFLKPPWFTDPDPDNFVFRLSGGQIVPKVQFFSYEPDKLPLGHVLLWAGLRIAGTRTADHRLFYLAGRAGSGKTELAANQFIQLARSGYGCLFLDPHRHNLDRLRPYLTGEADRVVELDFTGQGPTNQLAWNVLSLEGRPDEDIALKTRGVVEAFASVLHLGLFGEQQVALAQLTMAVQSVLELGRVLPAHLAPTIFQVGTMLADEEWRQATLPHLSPVARGFWERNATSPSEELIAPVTALLEQLRWSPAAAVLGATRSSYDLTELMDQGKVVLACTGGYSETQRLVANLFVYDLLNAALTRGRVPPGRRRPFHAFLDEVEIYDGAGAAYDGQGRGRLGDLLEQAGRYGLGLFLLNEDPSRLTPRTLGSILTNRTCLATFATEMKGAELLAKEWATTLHEGVGGPMVITLLDRYQLLAAPVYEEMVAHPFQIATISVRRMWGHCRDEPGVAELNRRIARNNGRRAERRTVEELDELDGWIREWLEDHPAGPPPPDPRRGAAAPASYGQPGRPPRLTLLPGGANRGGGDA